MNKLLRYSFATLLGILGILTSCKETEPTDPNQQLIANKDWHTDGLYFGVSATDGSGGSKAIAPNLKLRFSKTSTLNTTTINDKPLGAAAIWTLSADAKTLTVYYPTIAGGGATLASQALRVVKLTDAELWVSTPSQDDIQLFGIITLSPTSNYRFTKAVPTAVVPISEEALLKAVTWTGTGTNAGTFLNGTKQSDAPLEFKFTNFSALNINYLTVSNVPTPATWMLAKDANNAIKLTVAYPKIGSVAARAFTLNVNTLTASSLNFTGSDAITFTPTFSLPLSTEVRMIP
jgi:hypothetical protein